MKKRKEKKVNKKRERRIKTRRIRISRRIVKGEKENDQRKKPSKRRRCRKI